eukprot:scaffold415812_cov18-Prasinocladus_malaysianus.AAC.1
MEQQVPHVAAFDSLQNRAGAAYQRIFAIKCDLLETAKSCMKDVLGSKHVTLVSRRASACFVNTGLCLLCCWARRHDNYG